MEILPEIELQDPQHQAIQRLRNEAFPEGQHNRSYHKLLPHYRALQYEDKDLIAYAGLDYRAIRSNDEVYKVLGIIDFCVRKDKRGQGIGSSLMKDITTYAKNKDIDSIILISDVDKFYLKHDFQQIKAPCSWLRINEHKNYGVAFEFLDDLFIKPVGEKEWSLGHVDWLGYMF